MKINLAETLKTFKGEDMKEGKETLTVGMVLSNILATSKTGGKMKLFILAEKCYKETEIDIDEVDMGIVKQAIEANDMYFPVVTGQILKIIG